MVATYIWIDGFNKANTKVSRLNHVLVALRPQSIGLSTEANHAASLALFGIRPKFRTGGDGIPKRRRLAEIDEC